MIYDVSYYLSSRGALATKDLECITCMSPRSFTSLHSAQDDKEYVASSWVKDYTLENLELANRTLRRYIHELAEKILPYEHILQGCPKFRMEKSPFTKFSIRFEAPYEESEDPEDDWFDDFDDWEDDDFDEEDFDEEDFDE